MPARPDVGYALLAGLGHTELRGAREAVVRYLVVCGACVDLAREVVIRPSGRLTEGTDAVLPPSDPCRDVQRMKISVRAPSAGSHVGICEVTDAPETAACS